MTILKFMKTRIVYFENKLSQTSDVNPNIQIIPPAPETPFLYGVGEIKGSIHNWHHIPMNHYGLYCTTSEMQHLLEHSESITPVAAKATIGHLIPLAQYPGSTATLQLSFNNTIYGKCYHQPPSDHLAPMNDFSTVKEAYNWFRTFDGHRYVEDATGSQRQTLPSPNIRFVFPQPDYVGNHTGTDPRTVGYARELTIVRGMNNTLTTDQINAYLNRDTTQYSTFDEYNTYTSEMPMTVEDLARGYAPEFLQDAENLKALYPGENIDEIIIKLMKDQTYTIHNGETLLNQLWCNRDVRSLFTNSNLSFKDAAYLFMSLWPQCKGPTDTWSRVDDTISEGVTINRIQDNPLQYHGAETASSTAKTSAGFVDSFCRLLTGFKYNDFWNDKIPQLWIKGNEILDPSGSLVNHTFQATLCHELEVEVTERVVKPLTNPWKWINVYRVYQKVVIPGATEGTDGSLDRVKYVKGNPRWSQTDVMGHFQPIVCADNNDVTNNEQNYYSRAPNQINNQGPNWTTELPSYVESSKLRWTTNPTNLLSTSLCPDGLPYPGPSMNTRSKAQKRRATESLESEPSRKK